MLKFYSVIDMFRIYNAKTKKYGIRILYSYNENYSTQVSALLKTNGVLKTLQYMRSINKYIDCYDYYGVLPFNAVTLPQLPDEYLRHPCFCSKTLRSFDKVAPLIKMKFPSIDINPILLYGNSLVFDNPFVISNGNFLCKWQPYFEVKPSKNLFSVQGDYLAYNYHQDIFILTNDVKRHIPSSLDEMFIINLVSGKITLTRRYVENLHLYFESYEWNNGWRRIKYNEEEIIGFKRM